MKLKTVKKNAATSSFHQSSAPIIVEASKIKDRKMNSDRGSDWITGFSSK